MAFYLTATAKFRNVDSLIIEKHFFILFSDCFTSFPQGVPGWPPTPLETRQPAVPVCDSRKRALHSHHITVH